MGTTSWTSNRILLGLAAVGMFVGPGCVGSGPTGPGADPTTLNPSVGDDDDDDDDVIENGTTLTGVVRDSMGLPLMNATVTTSTGLSADTDFDGKFTFTDLEPAVGVLVTFTKDGYARTQMPIDILEDVENTVLKTMATRDVLETFSSSAGLSFQADDATVILPADNFVDASGAAYTGDVTVEATWFDLEGEIDMGNEILATPGDFTALDLAGDEQRLESFGMLQVNLFGENGEELDLAGGTASVRIPVVDWGSDAVPVAGETVPAWSYDEATGKWIEEGVFNIVEDADGLWAEFEAPHFSTWNCDQPIQTHGCVSGRLTDTQGAPRAGATARFVGQTYVSTTTARTGQNGNFCIEVKNGETGFVEFSYTIGGQQATQRTEPVTIPAGQGTCTDGNTSDCVDIGEVPMDIVTCVQGIVTDSQGQAIPQVQVVSPQGGQAVTGADGSFCLTVPVFQTTDVYVVPGQQGGNFGNTLFQPKRVYSQPGLPACQNGCPNLVLLRPYAQTGCAEGSVSFGNQQQTATVPVEIFDASFPEVAIGTNLTNMDGSYCAEVPSGQEVTLRVGDAQFLCGEQTINVSNNGGTCDSNQGGECASVPTINCNF